MGALRNPRYEIAAQELAADTAPLFVLLDRPAAWLKCETGTELLKPVADDKLRMWPVSRRVNKTGSGDDDPTLIDEVSA